MNGHLFCRVFLRLAREEAEKKHVAIPKNITAITSDFRQFFIEADGIKGEYIQADCAYEAKAKFIHSLIDKAMEQDHGNGDKY